MASDNRTERPADAALEAPARHEGEDDHDRGLIVERLGWTYDQRLDANAAFLRFYFSIRPEGPLIGDE